MIFLPVNEGVREECKYILNKHIGELGFELIGYRDVPTDNRSIGATAKSLEPKIEQVFIRHKTITDPAALERKIYVLKKYTTHFIGHNVEGNIGEFYFVSFSYKTIAYKGQLRTDQLASYYPDLNDKRLTSALALVHSRFSTNTFPKWKLAQPFKLIAHNGEINTIRGNVNWMSSKESLMESCHFSKEDIARLLPICDAEHSDSANLDSMIEILTLGGRSLAHSIMMVIPEAWQENNLMSDVDL